MLLIRYTSQAQPNNLFSVQWWLRVVTRTVFPITGVGRVDCVTTATLATLSLLVTRN